MRSTKSYWIFAALISCSVVTSGCQTTGPYTRDGALTGGLTGTAIGAVIGAADGKPLEGALIGAASGTALGGAVGNSIDREVAEQRAEHQLLRQQALAGSIGIGQVISMSQSGLDDQIIINQINSQGVATRPTPTDLMTLKQAGVSNEVIGALQTAAPVSVPARHIERPIIVEEHWVAPPGYYHYPPRGRYCHPYRRRHGWDFSVHF